MDQPTDKEIVDAQTATWDHIAVVRKLGEDVGHAWAERLLHHDASKLVSPEAEMFAVYTPRLKSMTYGSDEYKQCLAEMGEVLKHHYQQNRHHPEHFSNGIEGMTLIDLLEMLVDWKAATLRHADGSMLKSLEINSRRFNIHPQLQMVLANTAQAMGWLSAEQTVPVQPIKPAPCGIGCRHFEDCDDARCSDTQAARDAREREMGTCYEKKECNCGY